MPADASIKALAERVRNLRGWRRRAAAFAAGAISVLAMAPFFAWPVLWLTLPALVWLIDGAVGLPHPQSSSSPRRRGLLQLPARDLSTSGDPHLSASGVIRWRDRPEVAAA